MVRCSGAKAGTWIAFKGNADRDDHVAGVLGGAGRIFQGNSRRGDALAAIGAPVTVRSRSPTRQFARHTHMLAMRPAPSRRTSAARQDVKS